MRIMSPFEATLMTGDAISNPMHEAALLIFRQPDDAGPRYLADLYEHGLSGTFAIDPRLARKPSIGLGTLGMWTWEDVDVDPAQHFERRILSPGATDDELWRLVADLHGQVMDRSRPQWRAYQIEGLPDGRFAFYIKVHHALVDGVAGMQMIVDHLSPDPSQRSMPTFYSAGEHAPAQQIRRSGTRIPNPVSTVRSAITVGRRAFGLARGIVGGEVDYLAGSLKGTSVLPMSAPFTRFNGPLGSKRVVAGGAWEYARIRAIQEHTGCTANDVLTAIVAGALRGWLIAHDELPTRSLVAFCPISVRVATDRKHAEQGNMFGLELCPLGTDLADPAERLRSIHAAMTWAKNQVATHGSAASTLVAAPSIAPTFLISMLPFGPKWRTGYNVPISNLRGPNRQMYYNGARLETIYPVSTVFDGLGLNVTMYSYAGQVCFGFVAGHNLMPDVDMLVPLTDQALVDLEKSVGVSRA